MHTFAAICMQRMTAPEMQNKTDFQQDQIDQGYLVDRSMISTISSQNNSISKNLTLLCQESSAAPSRTGRANKFG